MCRYWFYRDHVNGLQWRFTKSTKLSTIRHSQLPKVRLASHSQQSFLHKVSPSSCAIFAVFSDFSSHREKLKKCPRKMSTVPRSPGRGLENLQLRDRKIEVSRFFPLQEMSRCYERFRCLWKSFCILWSVSETSDYTRKILFKIVTVDPPKPLETVTDRRSPTSNRSSWKWREVESDEREFLPFIGDRLLIDYLEYFSEICAHT